jgi:hypothetical protein
MPLGGLNVCMASTLRMLTCTVVQYVGMLAGVALAYSTLPLRGGCAKFFYCY